MNRVYLSNVWNFSQLPSIMPKYCNFDNRPEITTCRKINRLDFGPPAVE